MKKQRWLDIILFTLLVIGIIDSFQLTVSHYQNAIPPCGASFSDCGSVLRSSYAYMFGVPLALIGLIFYALEFVLFANALLLKEKLLEKLLFISTAGGVVFSLYFVFLQLFVLKAICLYCMISAFVSFVLYFLVRKRFWKTYQSFFFFKSQSLYQYLIKPILFQIDPQHVHETALKKGELVGHVPLLLAPVAQIFTIKDRKLQQTIDGIHFENPIGLAAGYDFSASLTQTLYAFGFGFQTVGTITNGASNGNAGKHYGRLVKSKSLLVNKGFKNPGSEVVIENLMGKKFRIPVGVSIGRTNDDKIDTIRKSVDDTMAAFESFIEADLANDYYELNISCPNLKVEIDFYTPKNLEKLLKPLKALKVKKPIYVKMPINISDKKLLQLCEMIHKYGLSGVIIGNLQKNRKYEGFDKNEIRTAAKGNFSGKPTFAQSNHLIEAAYKEFKNELTIIGCGGVFTADDAWEKIIRGASLVQMITGMIFEGPQRIGQINLGLLQKLKEHKLKNISEAVGSKSTSHHT